MRMQRKVASCHLVCLQKKHDPIPLADGVPVRVGRSPATQIIDPRCSRNQVEVVANWSDVKVSVKQMGANTSAIDGTDIGQNETTTMGPGSILFILSGQYPHKLVFEEFENKNVSSKKESAEKDSGIESRLSSDNPSPDYKTKTKIEQLNSIGSPSSRKKQEMEGKHHDNERRQSIHKEKSERKRSRDCSLDEHPIKKKRSSEIVPKDDDSEDKHVKDVAKRLEEIKKNAEKTSKHLLSSSSRPETNDSHKSHKHSLPTSSNPHAKGASDKNSWTAHEHLHVYTSKGVFPSSQIFGFDIDGTMIFTKSGKKFPTDCNDWKIAYPDAFRKLKSITRDGHKIVFFTNQLGVARGKVKLEDLKKKIENIVHTLQVPVQVFVATHEGKYRKPSDGMWKKLRDQYNSSVAIDLEKSIYVGDAAGRPMNWAPKKQKDFSSSDRLFALNVGVKFQTPEEFFLKQKEAPFVMPVFDPRFLSTDAPIVPKGCSLTSTDREILVLVGFPACGKSHLANNVLKRKGYAVINRDILGSWQKCVRKAKEAIVNSKVVIDNTNLTKEERSRYIECAKEADVPCRCLVFTTTIEHCRHNERFRQLTDKSHAKINEMIFNKTKSKFEEPSMKEGFSEISNVNFVPSFSSTTQEAEYRKFLLEK